ncbi:Voltage-dependent calcium channel gamma-3 subunit [Trichostrongylus colubriformis]|uniref:Voltage-dependent calcium channel gamma-3 subunit n=1 Tax=Trichostrongylus colubriformis TaxID=6319 RepID=A0AAN8F8F5_TRICO
MMVIPVSQHKLIKIRRINRKKLTRLALYCSLGACISNGISSCTNSWLYTSEVLKYYVSPNNTQGYDDSQLNDHVYFKNASLGPWQYCWLDPMTDFHCNSVQFFVDEDPSDVTTSVQQSIRRAFLIMMIGMILDIIGLILATTCNLLPNPYASLFVSTVVHINAGIANFLCIVVFMSAVSKEVGNKIHPASEMDDPLFHFEYGFSFILLKSSFLLTELAALFSIVVYMAKRDERTFNRYKIRSLLNFSARSLSDDKTDTELIQESCNNPPTRFNRGRRGGICSPPLSHRTSLDTIASPPSKHNEHRNSVHEQPGAMFRPGFGTSNYSKSKWENIILEDEDIDL